MIMILIESWGVVEGLTWALGFMQLQLQPDLAARGGGLGGT
jgi:hypothetical protein